MLIQHNLRHNYILLKLTELDTMKNIVLIKYHDIFIFAVKMIKRIEERSVLTMIVNNDEKDSSVNELNLTATKLCIELLSDHYFNNNDFYDDNDYKNNINFRLCNHN